MIAFGGVGAQTPSAQKWIFFLCGMLCFGHVCMVLLKYMGVNKYGEDARELYNKVATMTIILWTLYPIVWVLAEGARLVSPSLEACYHDHHLVDSLSNCLGSCRRRTSCL